MLSSAGANPLALRAARKKPSDDRPPCLENPRPEGAESTLTENAASPFQAEPRQAGLQLCGGRPYRRDCKASSFSPQNGRRAVRRFPQRQAGFSPEREWRGGEDLTSAN